MRKIENKACSLSEIYKKEFSEWESGMTTDPDFNTYQSSNFRHYCSVKMELLRCQKGLCAYTERRLCSPEFYSKNNWSNGVYKLDCKSEIMSEVKGQIDHFDSSLKKENPWLWDNLFVVYADANAKKLQKVADFKFKPDNHAYNPLDWFDYDVVNHHFIPKGNLNEDEKESVRKVIKTLGIFAARYDRERYLNEKIDLIKKGILSIEELEIDEFPTAFSFCVKKLKLV